MVTGLPDKGIKIRISTCNLVQQSKQHHMKVLLKCSLKVWPCLPFINSIYERHEVFKVKNWQLTGSLKM